MRPTGSVGAQQGSRTPVEPSKRKRRKSPSDRARDARRLVTHIEDTTAGRHEAWARGDAGSADTTTQRLDRLHVAKRAMRRSIYRQRPTLEGQPVHRGQPGAGS